MNYFTVPAISNSSLAYIDPDQGGCPLKMKDYIDGNMKQEKKRFYEVGDALHKAILEPGTLIVADFDKPSEKIEEIIDLVTNSLSVGDGMPDISSVRPQILEAVKATGYQANWKDDTRVDKVIELGKDYYNFCLSADGKVALDLKSKEILDKMTYAIRTNPETNRLIEGFEGFERLVEHEIFWEYVSENPKHTFKCKSKLDLLYINHEKKVFHIVDLKSTADTLHSYPNKFEEYKYYRQIAFYELAVLYMLEKQGKPGYTCGTHYQVVVEKKGYYNCAPFVISNLFVNLGRKNISKLFNILAHHTQTGNWVYPMMEDGTMKKVIALSPSESALNK